MAETLEKLVDHAANLAPFEFAEFLHRLAEERARRGLPMEAQDDTLEQEDLLLSQQALVEDWDGVPDDWEAHECPSPEAK